MSHLHGVVWGERCLVPAGSHRVVPTAAHGVALPRMVGRGERWGGSRFRLAHSLGFGGWAGFGAAQLHRFQVALAPAKVCRAVEPAFDGDLGLGHGRIGFGLVDLVEAVLVAEGEVGSDHSSFFLSEQALKVGALG